MSIYKPQDLEHFEARGELVERLRGLRWPEPSGPARRRSWELLTARLEEGAETGLPADPPPPEAQDAPAQPGAGRVSPPGPEPSASARRRRVGCRAPAGASDAGSTAREA